MMTPATIAATLAQVPLFSDLPEHDRLHLAHATRPTQLSKGEILFHRGEACEGVYVVVNGQLKLSLLAANGMEKVVELIRAGQTCGEALMFLDKDYIVTASALSDTQVLHVGKIAILQGLAQDAHFARRMLAGLSRRMHGLICDIVTKSGNRIFGIVGKFYFLFRVKIFQPADFFFYPENSCKAGRRFPVFYVKVLNILT